MDVIFNCPKCEQELAVDSTGAGTEIDCPSCGETIVIPTPELVVNRPGVDSATSAPRVEVHPVNPIASSAARGACCAVPRDEGQALHRDAC